MHLIQWSGRGLSGERAAHGQSGALQGRAGQTTLLQPAAVVGDLEGTALVVVQPTSWKAGEVRRGGILFTRPI